MIIQLSPQRSDDQQPVLSRLGDVLVINGEPFDFSDLNEGDLLPAEAVASDWIVGGVERKDGAVRVTVLLPHGKNAPADTLFPEPIANPPDGLVFLPPRELQP
jgi:hypothetical protein